VEWLTRWWKELFRDMVLTGAGLAVIGSQVIAAQPQPYLIGAGLALTLPSTYVKIREIIAIPGHGGGSGPPSLPPGQEPSPLPSGSANE
jgi:hypothetical protein